MTTTASHQPLILIVGATGQVGRSLLTEAVGLGRVLAAARTGAESGIEHADLADPSSLVQLVRRVKPQVIINAAAYTAVDKAEQDESAALQANGVAPAVLADEAKRLGSLFIHYSSDYVFDGSGSNKRREEDFAVPLSAYGRSKLAGEQAIAAVGGRSVILRTSWVFSAYGHNFVKTMLRLGGERERIQVVSDQVGSPTSASYIAKCTAHVVRTMLGNKDPLRNTGTYHLACDGETSWYGFAVEIFSEARRLGATLKVQEVVPIHTIDYPLPALRPLNSRLDTRKFAATFATRPALWQDELRAVIEKLLAPG